MFLENITKNKDLAKYSFDKFATTYPAQYRYWYNVLFERCMRLFVWENTGDVPPKEIEQRLLIQGHAGIAKYKKEGDLTAFFGNPNTPTKYYDEFLAYTVRCPLWSDNLKIGRDVVMINNNALRNPVLPLVHHYAALLAHADVTIVNTLVNARDAGGVPIVATEKQKQNVNEYLGKRYNGQYGVITDIGSLGVEYAGANTMTQQSIVDIVEAKERILKSFYNDIGVRAAFAKKSNTVEAEVDADASLLLLNLSDMLAMREKGCEEVNKLFGTNWSVHIAEELQYEEENEIETDTETEKTETEKEGEQDEQADN
jgi:hypothetical protein